MSMEITGIVGPGTANHISDQQRMPTLTEQRAAFAERQERTLQTQPPDIEAVLSELRLVTSALNRRLKFSVNQELDQVVVKVIDNQTDKVIKELPPEGIRRLHARIQEALGLLIDEVI